MEFRHLGRSGLMISEIAYGNWITHGGQVEADAATACVRAALDAGITSFDTADVYAEGRAEEVLGRALAAEPRSSIEIFTKVYGRTGRRWSRTSRSTPRCAGCGRPSSSPPAASWASARSSSPRSRRAC